MQMWKEHWRSKYPIASLEWNDFLLLHYLDWFKLPIRVLTIEKVHVQVSFSQISSQPSVYGDMKIWKTFASEVNHYIMTCYKFLLRIRPSVLWLMIWLTTLGLLKIFMSTCKKHYSLGNYDIRDGIYSSMYGVLPTFFIMRSIFFCVTNMPYIYFFLLCLLMSSKFWISEREGCTRRNRGCRPDVAAMMGFGGFRSSKKWYMSTSCMGLPI